MKRLAVTLGMFAAMLPAQKLALPGNRERLLQLLDVQQMLTPKGANVQPLPAGHLARLAAFVRSFAVPAFAAGDDVQPLGDRYLAVLGSAQQCAAVEQLLVLSQRHAEQLLGVQIEMFKVPAKLFAQQLQPFFAAGATPQAMQRIVGDAEAAPLLAALQASEVEAIEAPRLCVGSLQAASMSIGERISYVRDFHVSQNGAEAMADPIVDTVFDGTEIELLAAFLPDATIGLQCTVQHQVVQRPLLQTKVDLGVGAPVTIQLPRTTTVRLEQRAALPLGATMVLAAVRQDGSYLLATVRVDRQP